MQGNILSFLALAGCIPLVLYLFKTMESRIAALVAFMGVFMFWPMDHLNVPVIKYDKMAAVSIGAILGVKLFDEERLAAFSLHPVDIPMLLWCSAAFMASMTNGLGAYDGFTASLNTVLAWGLPWIIGRIFFSDPNSLRFLGLAFFLGGVAYIPFVLYETRMAPVLHMKVYGYMQHDFAQCIRQGGYRPMVFMEHGIMVGTWIAMSALTGAWCWYSNVFPKKIWKIPTVVLVVALLVTSVLCKSSGALGLMLVGLAVLALTTKLKTPVLIFLLLLIPTAYYGTRATGYWDGQNLVDAITENFSEERAGSLQFRFENENILVEKALQKPVFGWGGWGRARVYDEDGEDISVTDGFWIISFGNYGLFGLASVTLACLLPMILFVLKCPTRFWNKPEYAPSAVLAMVPLLFIVDCMLNCMVNPVFVLFAGGVSGSFALHGIRDIRPVHAKPGPDQAQEGPQPTVVPEAVPALQAIGSAGTGVSATGIPFGRGSRRPRYRFFNPPGVRMNIGTAAHTGPRFIQHAGSIPRNIAETNPAFFQKEVL